MDTSYDVVIVGGRCAGASLAIFLARQGASVAIVEADRLGTDQVVSTHTIHPPGMDVLDDIGVGNAVRDGAPPMRVARLDVGSVWAQVQFPEGRHECCPRRFRLDRLLQDAALAAGVEIFPLTRVAALRRDGDRVTGVEAVSDGRPRILGAALVVGADGRHSTVARLAGADEYLGYDWPRAMYWAYWRPPAVWESDEYPFDMLLRMPGHERHIIFPTDDGELLLGTVPEAEIARSWRGNHRARYLDNLRADPVFRPLMDGGTMTSDVVGTLHERFFYRRAAGPGWALVGDAGHHKDPLVGWGISEALIQARQLAAAIAKGSDVALQRYWRRRDVDSLPRYFLGQERGDAGAINPVMSVVVSRARTAPWLAAQMIREMEYEVNPYQLLPMGAVVRWVLAAALRGRPGLIGAFLAQGKRMTGVQRHLKQARARLRDVEHGQM